MNVRVPQLALYPGLPIFFNETLKNMGRPRYEAIATIYFYIIGMPLNYVIHTMIINLINISLISILAIVESDIMTHTHTHTHTQEHLSAHKPAYIDIIWLIIIIILLLKLMRYAYCCCFVIIHFLFWCHCGVCLYPVGINMYRPTEHI